MAAEAQAPALTVSPQSFVDLLKHDGVVHVDENYYMEAAMKPHEDDARNVDDPLA